MQVCAAQPGELGEPLADLIERVTGEQGAPPFGEVLRAAMNDPAGGGLGYAVRESGRLVSFAFTAANPDGRVWTLEFADSSGQPDRFLGEVVRGMDAAGIEETVLWLHTPAIEPSPALFTHERDLYRMAATLPVPGVVRPPAGVRFAGFDVHRDAQALIEVNNRAFDGHPEQGEWSAQDLVRRTSLPWFDPRGVRTGWIDDRLVAFHWTKVHDTPAPDGGALGEIYVLAVDPAFHGRGLGRAIALDGLDYLYRHRKATRAILYVDAASVAAVNLYRRLGFATEHTDRAFRRTRGS
ncbi:mycothiol synthase [Candidatus Spongiisocius sp.]|uniref:mycothiol synthase n=1 Tax=Candidatus Spongiisocius sp. TaxID=3101273 RepID=UPI003B590B25